jgi:nucleotide-binding universal stress UspA family protein
MVFLIQAAVLAKAKRPLRRNAWPEGSDILDEVEKWGADLIVLGSHGYRGWRRFLLGSVSHAVATHARCSVEIVRRRFTG